MSKWTFRFFGLLVVVAASSFLFKNWFFPKTIPPALQQEIAIHVDGKEVGSAPATAPKPASDNSGDKPPGPPLTLLSYDGQPTSLGTQSEPKTAGVERIAPPPPPKIDSEIVEAAPATPPPAPKIAPVAKPEPASQPEPVAKAEPEPEPEPTPPPKPAPAPKVSRGESIKVPEQPKGRRGGNWVQAGAFSNQENARNFVARLKRKSWPVTTEDAVVNGKLMHRVLVGPLSSADVEAYINILGKMGFNARQVSR